MDIDKEPEDIIPENVKQIMSPGTIHLPETFSIVSLMHHAGGIKDQKKQKEKLSVLQKAFEKRYGINSNDGCLHVLMIASDPLGCGYVRIDKPSKYVNREYEFVSFPTVTLTLELLAWANIVVWQRQHKKELIPFRDMCKKLNKVQIYDIDDNLHCVEKNNPAYASYNPTTEAYKNILEWIKACDFLTVTKPALGEFYKEKTGKNYFVLPNCIDFEDFPKREVKQNLDKPIRIGWIGSVTHFDDLKLTSYAINNLKKKYGDKIEFVMMGFDGKLRSHEAVKRNVGGKEVEMIETKIFEDAFEGVKREFHKFVNTYDYYKALVDLDLDIGIIPVTRCEFNDTGKSNLKWIEMSAAKIPCVVSKSPVYSDVENGVTGFVAKREADFERHLEALIESQELRSKIAENAYAFVRNNYDMSMKVSEWINLYRYAVSVKIQNIDKNSADKNKPNDEKTEKQPN